jgi:hypothetical protein
MKVWSKALREREGWGGGGGGGGKKGGPIGIIGFQNLTMCLRLGILLEISIYFKFEGSHMTFTLEALKQKEKGQ